MFTHFSATLKNLFFSHFSDFFTLCFFSSIEATSVTYSCSLHLVGTVMLRLKSGHEPSKKIDRVKDVNVIVREVSITPCE